MAKDVNGVELKVGDRVIVVGTVTDLSSHTEEGLNVGFKPFPPGSIEFGINSHSIEKAPLKKSK